MNPHLKIQTLVVVLLAVTQHTVAHAQPDIIGNEQPSSHVSEEQRNTWLKRYWDNLIHGNVDRTFERPMDWSFAVSPTYTQEGGVGLGSMGTALFRLNKRDSITQPSDASFFVNASLKGFFGLGSNGNVFLPDQHSRISYSLLFQRKMLDFWGTSYDACSINPISEYTRNQILLKTDYIYMFEEGVHIGLTWNLKYINVPEILDPAYLEQGKTRYFMNALGLSVLYDTRDHILTPTQGLHIMVKGLCYPAFLGTENKTLFSTIATLNSYHRLWKGGVMAFDLYGCINSHDMPWILREEVGSDGSRMRGYYAGRYMDINQLNTQIELRQHLYGRFGFVAWGGVGAVFPSFCALTPKHLLPTYGLGVRIEFKHNMNLRIDYGFGRDTGGLVLRFGEAF